MTKKKTKIVAPARASTTKSAKKKKPEKKEKVEIKKEQPELAPGSLPKPKVKRKAKDGTDRGRPALMDLKPNICDDIIKAVRMGNYLETAAAYAGITKETLFAWLRRGAKEDKGPFKDFSDSITKGLAEAEMLDLGRIQEASKTNWQAAAWKLERRNPNRWGRKDRTPVTPEEEAIDYDSLSDEELDHVIATGTLPNK